MGGDPPSTNELAASQLQALAQYAPAAIKAISGTAMGTAKDTLDVQKATAPGYAELQNQIYGQYGPEANRIGNQINDMNQKAALQTEAEMAAGPSGQGLVKTADQLQRQLDPEAYAARAATGAALDKYLSSYSPTEMTGSELEQINRGISGRQGPLSQSALNTVKNAGTFGRAATERWQNFGNALQQASSVLPGLKSGLTGFEIATRRPLTSNTGEGRLSTPAANNATSAMNTNFGFANNALNNIAASQQTAINKKQSGLDMFKGIAGGIGSLFGG